jgi:trehalose 6-phosphate phosphatase
VEYVFDRTRRILEQLRESKHIFLFLDYDGTLTPIVFDPEEAHLSGEMKDLLLNLKKNPRVHLAIVSGRSIADIRKRAGLKGIFYVGNHGLEISGPKGGTKRSVPKEVIQRMRGVRNRLNSQLRKVAGVHIEDKGCILAVHYRNADLRSIPSVLMTIKQEMKDSINSFCLVQGKFVFEVRPKSARDKGVAVLELLNRVRQDSVLPLYIGDEQTDEDAFKVLGRQGITITVGSPSFSSARYFIKDPAEVHRFLASVQNELR